MAPALAGPHTKAKRLQVRVQVTDQKQFLTWLHAALPHVRSAVTPLPAVLLLNHLSPPDFSVLTQCSFVTFIDVAHRVPQEEAYLQNADLTVNRVEAVHVGFPQITGKGLVVSVKEKPFDATDLDFKGRVIPTAPAAGAPTPHATSMATLVAGGGNTSPGGKGAAWQSHVLSSDFSRLLPDETSWLKSHQVSVQNHSYGVGVENYYGLESQAYDAQTLALPELLHVFSSGNAGVQTPAQGPYAGVPKFANLTGQFKTSKNTLAVGAIDTSGQVSALSSKGPTFDGRIKPEVVAFGESGSSEASAVVSGVAALLQQVYQEQQNGVLPPAALVKAALINSAKEKGRPGVDYEAGFGSIDALAAVRTVQAQRYHLGSVAQGEEQVFPITVPASAARLKVTLVWHDLAGDPAAASSLVNDLDLTLHHQATGQQWLPWGLSAYPHPDSLRLPARRQTDRRNNVEQVTLDLPAVGLYHVKVKGHRLRSPLQAFSLVYGVEEKLEWVYPSSGSQLKAGQVNRLRWLAPLAGSQTAKIEFRWAGKAWQVIQEKVPFHQQSLDWRAPDSAGLAQVRITASGGEVLSSGIFQVSPVLPLEVGYQCEGEVMLFWPKAKGVATYQVYQLGAQFLEPLPPVQDTVYLFPKERHPGVHFAVAPVIGASPGIKSFTLDYQQQGVDCYIKNFVARNTVTDSVRLHLELSTVYGLAGVFLERLSQGVFQTVQELSKPANTQISWFDLNATPGPNQYRVKVVTTNQQVFYSATETVFYTPKEFIQVFPNPVVAGGELQVVVADDALAQIQFVDHLGRLVKETKQDGAVKKITTNGLKAGVYVLKITSLNEQIKMVRVVVL
ncbi:S8 family serine peptidase [Rufibacter glacialis]|nr:S8 family serine peptidase [Rufibacter glacialis]